MVLKNINLSMLLPGLKLKAIGIIKSKREVQSPQQ
jgi:hypothetical protein